MQQGPRELPFPTWQVRHYNLQLYDLLYDLLEELEPGNAAKVIPGWRRTKQMHKPLVRHGMYYGLEMQRRSLHAPPPVPEPAPAAEPPPPPPSPPRTRSGKERAVDPPPPPPGAATAAGDSSEDEEDLPPPHREAAASGSGDEDSGDEARQGIAESLAHQGEARISEARWSSARLGSPEPLRNHRAADDTAALLGSPHLSDPAALSRDAYGRGLRLPPRDARHVTRISHCMVGRAPGPTVLIWQAGKLGDSTLTDEAARATLAQAGLPDLQRALRTSVPLRPEAVRPAAGATLSTGELPGPQPGMAAVHVSAAQLSPTAPPSGKRRRKVCTWHFFMPFDAYRVRLV